MVMMIMMMIYQIVNFQISTKSDVWSLGCILYSLVYNRTPFDSLRLPLLKLQAIMNPAHVIQFPETQHPHVVDVLKVNHSCSWICTCSKSISYVLIHRCICYDQHLYYSVFNSWLLQLMLLCYFICIYLQKCLDRNPRTRPTVDDLLKHPYVTGGHTWFVLNSYIVICADFFEICRQMCFFQFSSQRSWLHCKICRVVYWFAAHCFAYCMAGLLLWGHSHSMAKESNQWPLSPNFCS